MVKLNSKASLILILNVYRKVKESKDISSLIFKNSFILHNVGYIMTAKNGNKQTIKDLMDFIRLQNDLDHKKQLSTITSNSCRMCIP